MGIDNLGVAYNLTAGNLSVAGSIPNGEFPVLTTNTGYTKAEVDTSLNGKQNKLTAASIVDVDELTCWNKLETNILTGRNVSQATVQDNLKVTRNAIIEGSLDVATDINVNSVFASGPITSTGLLTNSVICNGDMSIIGGTINGYSPFWAAGRVAANGTIENKKGSVDFSCTRTAAGNYLITFAQPHPDGANYAIQLSSYVFFSQVNGSIVPTELNFRVRLTNASLQDTDSVFYFAVLA
jgi:hypothetical protein